MGTFEYSLKYRYYVLVLLFLAYVFNFVDRYILIILLDPIKAELNVSDTAMGLLTGFSFAIMYSVTGIPLARYADRGSRRSLIALGLFVWSGMTAISGVAQNFTHLLLARIGVGLGEAAASPASHSLISDYFPVQRRSSALSIYNCGIPIGIMLGLVMGGWLYEYFGWRAAFIAVGLPGILLALLIRFTIKDPPRGYSDPDNAETQQYTLMETLRLLLSLKSFVLYAIGLGLFNMAFFGFDIWVPAFLGRVHGMGTAEIGTWIGLMAGGGGVAGALFGGWMADRLVVKDVRWHLWIQVLSSLACILPMLIFILGEEQAFAIWFYLPVSFFGVMGFAPIISLTHQLVKPSMRSLSSAILFFIMSLIGQGFGPLTVGVLNDLLHAQFGNQAIRYSLMMPPMMIFLSAVFYYQAAKHLPSYILDRNFT